MNSILVAIKGVVDFFKYYILYILGIGLIGNIIEEILNIF